MVSDLTLIYFSFNEMNAFVIRRFYPNHRVGLKNYTLLKEKST